MRRRTFLASASAVLASPSSPRPGYMLWDHIVGSIRRLDQVRARRLAAIRTPAQLAALQRDVRQKLALMWGGFPAERTPLNPRHVGTLTRSGYVVEKLIFESRPRFFVTANLYRPPKPAGPLPALLFPPGHSDNGKAADSYQRFCILMARLGFVVLTWDPLGQGERLQLWDPATASSLAGGPGTREHSALGKPCYLLGLNLMAYRVWDALRAIDYLESRPDVDPRRIGLAGQSGGGMETLQFAPFETRLQAAASICAVASFRHKTEALLMADPEQILFETLAHGIDHPELLAAVAPRALVIGATRQDFVPIDGARRTHREIQPLYALLNASAKLSLVEVDDKHAFNQELREAIARHLLRWLASRDEIVHEPPSQPEPDDALACTPTGQVASSLGGETVFTLNRKRLEQLLPKRSLPNQRALAEAARRVTRLDLTTPEPAIFVPSRAFGPPRGPAVILVAEAGKDDPALHRDIVAPLIDTGFRVIAIDVRGWGETRPDMPDRKASFSWDDFFAYRALELGRPLFGQRLRDLLVTAPRLAAAKSWSVVGVASGALLAAYAALLDPRFARVAAVAPLLSYRSLVEDPLATQPFSLYLPDVLAAFDIPDLFAALAPRPLLVINPEDSRRRPVSQETAAALYPTPTFTLRTGVDPAGPAIARWLRA